MIAALFWLLITLSHGWQINAKIKPIKSKPQGTGGVQRVARTRITSAAHSCLAREVTSTVQYH